MTAYLLTVVTSAVILTVLEYVIPHGRINSTVKTVVCVIFTAIMISPIIKGDLSSVENDGLAIFDSEISMPISATESLEEYLGNEYMKRLKSCDLIAEKVKVEFSGTEIKKVYVYLSNMVIEENTEHINITVIENYVAGALNLKAEQVSVYA